MSRSLTQRLFALFFGFAAALAAGSFATADDFYGDEELAAADLPNGVLYFSNERTYIGHLEATQRKGRDCMRLARADSPTRECLLVRSRDQDGQALTMSYVDLKDGKVEFTGYFKFGGLQQHPHFGSGYYGTLVQTHTGRSGSVQPEPTPVQAQVFLQLP